MDKREIPPNFKTEPTMSLKTGTVLRRKTSLPDMCPTKNTTSKGHKDVDCWSRSWSSNQNRSSHHENSACQNVSITASHSTVTKFAGVQRNQVTKENIANVPLNGEEVREDSGEPNLRLLENVVAYVEVRDGNEDHSEVCAQQLERLGATVVKNLTRKVTHVIYRNGRKGTYDKATNWNIPLLSSLWIERCKQENTRAAEDDYPAIIPSTYTSPYYFEKTKRFRPMQPKAWKETKDVVTKLEQREKRKKRREFVKNYKTIIHKILSPSKKSSTDKTSSLLDGIHAASPDLRTLSPSVSRSRDILDLLEEDEDNIALSQEHTWNIPLAKRLILQSPAFKDISEADENGDSSPNTSGLLNVSLRTMKLLGLDSSSAEGCDSVFKVASPCASPQLKVNTEYNNKHQNSCTDRTTKAKCSECFSELKPTSLFKGIQQIKTKSKPELKENLQMNSSSCDLFDNVCNSTKLATCSVGSPNTTQISSKINGTLRKNATHTERHLFSGQSCLLTGETPESERRGIKRSRESVVLVNNGFATEIDCDKAPPRHSLDDFDIAVTKKSKGLSKDGCKSKYYTIDIPKDNSIKLPNGTNTTGKEVVPSVTGCKTSSVTNYIGRRLFVESETACRESKTKTKSLTKNMTVLPSIVTTSIHKDEQETINSIILGLGGYQLISDVNETTTIVVSGDSRRTLNVLFAIARGCWLVSKDWVFKSLEAEHWVDEEPYELFDAFPAAQLTRLERCVLGNNFRHVLFQDVGKIYVADNTAPPSDKLKELISFIGGEIVSLCRQAKICIGNKTTTTDIQCASPKWVLDCITKNAVLPLKDYLLT